MSPFCTLLQISLFGRGLHHSSLPVRFRVGVVRSGRQELARRADQGDYRTVAHGYLAKNPHGGSGLISAVERNLLSPVE